MDSGNKLLKRYYALLKEQKLIEGSINVLRVDQENWMPPKTASNRGEEVAYLSALHHQKRTDKEFVDVVNKLNDQQSDLEAIDARSVEVSKRSIDRELKLPKDFVEEFTKLTTVAHKVWAEARKKKDYSVFESTLGEIIEMVKRKAAYIDDSKPEYDVLIDEFEEGMTAVELKKTFGELKDELSPILKEVLDSKKDSKVKNPFEQINVGASSDSATGGWPDYAKASSGKPDNAGVSSGKPGYVGTSSGKPAYVPTSDSKPVFRDVSSSNQSSSNNKNTSDEGLAAINQLKAINLVKEMTSQMGFDYDRGQLGVVEHPFEEALAPDDTRIHISFMYGMDSVITGAIHELGHGLYEQFVDPKYHTTELDSGISLGIHESQSRMLENMLGRSKPFWEWALPLLQSYFEEAKDWDIDEVLSYLNRVEPSLIRIEADELTYNLHIIVRFEIELGILNGDIKLEDIPEAWNAKYKELIGVDVPDDGVGCLQDVHWSMGAISYFPTYSLGNLNAGQLWNHFVENNKGWEEKISKGDFSVYFDWFKEHIWQHGSMYKPGELMEKVTGKQTDAGQLVEYLRGKYLG